LFNFCSLNGNHFFRFLLLFLKILEVNLFTFSDSEQFDAQLMNTNQDLNQMSSSIFAFSNAEYSQPVPNTPLQFSNVAIKPELSHASIKRKLSDSSDPEFMVDSNSGWA
jgi:hypothetical protein